MSARLRRWLWVAAGLGLLAAGAGSGVLARRRLPSRASGLAVGQDHAAARALLNRQRELEQRGRWAELAAAREEFIARFPSSWRRFSQELARGRDLERAGQIDAAIEHLRRVAARELGPRAHRATAAAAGVAARAGRDALALELFSAARPSLRGWHAERAAAWVRVLEARLGRGTASPRELAAAHLALDDRRGAEAVWAAAAKRGALQPEDRLARAGNLEALGESAAARVQYEKLLGQAPGHPAVATARYRRAGLLAAAGALDAARSAYEELLRRHPTGRHAADGWRGLGDLEVKAGRDAAALAAYTRALERADTPARRWAARISIGWCLIRLGRTVGAESHFNELARRARDAGQREQARRGLARARRER